VIQGKRVILVYKGLQVLRVPLDILGNEVNRGCKELKAEKVIPVFKVILV
jgi:hypothetical protein